MKGESTSMLNSAQQKWLIIYHSSKIDIWKNNLRCESFAMSFKKHNYIFFQNKIRPGKDHWQWVFNIAGSYIFPWSLMRPQAMMIMMTVVINYFWRMVDQQKAITPYFQLLPLSNILNIVNLWHVVSRIWTCTEFKFRIGRMKLNDSDNHYLTVPHNDSLKEVLVYLIFYHPDLTGIIV